jgi:hypothetical protein
MDKITSEIRKKGLTMQQFCDKFFKSDYKAFRYRVRTQSLRLSEIRQIITFTNLTFEQLFEDAPILDQPERTSKDKTKPIEEIDQSEEEKEYFIDTFDKE